MAVFEKLDMLESWSLSRLALTDVVEVVAAVEEAHTIHNLGRRKLTTLSTDLGQDI